MNQIEWSDFQKVDLRVGTILSANDLPNARKPAYVLQIDLGEHIGVKKSSAQITAIYSKEELIGKRVVCVTNFPPKQIGSIVSEVLVTGFPDTDGNVVLCTADLKVPNGAKLF